MEGGRHASGALPMIEFISRRRLFDTSSSSSSSSRLWRVAPDSISLLKAKRSWRFLAPRRRPPAGAIGSEQIEADLRPCRSLTSPPPVLSSSLSSSLPPLQTSVSLYLPSSPSSSSPSPLITSSPCLFFSLSPPPGCECALSTVPSQRPSRLRSVS